MSDRAPGTRKPYRISKPREKWSSGEHERFVNAINQHGRNWKRIVQEVGTRTVAQVRSHAQKYFLKLEKAGATEEVPPARAKRPSAKPYPIKSSGHGESSRSSQSGQHERKKLRRTERTSTKPVRQDFTFLDDSPPISTDGGTSDSIALLQGTDAEGKNSNASGSNGQSSARENSALSTAELDYANCLGVPSPAGRFIPEATVIQPNGEKSDPTDASSGAVAGTAAGSATDTPNYGELYDVVGKLYTNPNNSNQEHLMQQLGATQREELAHMLGQLTGEMRESVNPHEEQQAASGLGQPMFNLDSSMPQLLPTDGSGIGDNSDGTFSGLPSVPPDVPMDQSNTQGTDLLPSCAQPSDDFENNNFDNSDWRLSGDLKSLLAPDPEYSHLPQLIDTKMFDY